MTRIDIGCRSEPSEGRSAYGEGVELCELDAAYASVDVHQRELRERGVSVLPGFVRPEVIDAMVLECDALAEDAYHQDVQGTPYLELPADDWPESHPRVTWARSSVHTIGYDQFPTDSLLRALYESDELMTFLKCGTRSSEARRNNQAARSSGRRASVIRRSKRAGSPLT